jgi:hypothetical protein
MATLTYYTNGVKQTEQYSTFEIALERARQITNKGLGYVYSIVHNGKLYTRPEPWNISELDRLMWSELGEQGNEKGI